MTIEELITKLGAFDPDQNVCIVLGGSEDAGMSIPALRIGRGGKHACMYLQSQDF